MDLQEYIQNLEAERDRLYENLHKIEMSRSWRITRPFRYVGDEIRSKVNLMKKAVRYFKMHGGKKTILRLVKHWSIENKKKSILNELKQETEENHIWDAFSRWIDDTPHEFIDIFAVPMGWKTPLFQRFQHLSLQAGNTGGISIYGGHPIVDEGLLTYKFVSPSLCIVNLDHPSVYQKVFDILDTKKGIKYIRIQSIDLTTTIQQIESFIRRGYIIVYEYIDEITPQITGEIPDFIHKRHDYVLNNKEIILIATSDKLYSQARRIRSENVALLNNGVDVAHWDIKKKNIERPSDLKDVLPQDKTVVGYHGALAQWIDYELLRKIADDGRYFLLLIGHEHDNSFNKSGLLKHKNVAYLGSKDYQILNRYAAFYDIGILPFVVNDITLSVSPVKIFEYMAAGKPVVSYGLPECKKYVSCLCADTTQDFMALLEKAANLMTDKTYLNQLKNDAHQNTWQEITKRTYELVKKQYDNQKIELSKMIVNTRTSSYYRDKYIEQVLESPRFINKKEYVRLADDSFQRKEGDGKIIAYYLTQFHPDPHNEKWWGKGVTEWNNVVRAVPQYVGHYQPRVPGELGYYDLRIVENMKRQVELAKMYGIYGFSFYYYWFNGERLLEFPLEMFLKNKDIEFPFSLCWANENWTRRFDGSNSEILMEQPKSTQSYQDVIEDIARFLVDPRYMDIQGKKILTIYRPSLMPDVRRILQYWREYCRKELIGELYIIAVKENMVDTNWLEEGFDAVSEFHPGTVYAFCKNITHGMTYMRQDFDGQVFDYKDIIENQRYFEYDHPKLYRAAMPMWDNTARRDNKGMIFHGATPALYRKWLYDILREGKSRNDLEDNIIFINAWNEWGEGAYLEPDKQLGYAYLQATRDALEMVRNDPSI
ncbi:glycoside hydrolase family 99-like domain-containing protein [Avibacterium avium]|uniref:glycoside hydrolase family 99-like domain-containing protein n=1 Tax=Avibacterium avium TaxID=751 RepID=UPI003BF7DB19